MAWILIPAVVVVGALALVSRAMVVRHELSATVASAAAFRNDVRRARERIERDRGRVDPRSGSAGGEVGP